MMVKAKKVLLHKISFNCNLNKELVYSLRAFKLQIKILL